MKVGDLVTPNKLHGLFGYEWRSSGVVLESRPSSPNFKGHLVVRWNDGDVEIEIPDWLTLLNENN